MTSDYVVNGTVQTMPNAGFAELMAAVLARGAPFRFQASGFSMLPFIRDGDVITLSPTPAHLRFGDVVAFVNHGNDRLIVHRIVHITRHGYFMRGDNLPEPDGFVSHAGILGRVILVERRGRCVRLGLGLERVVIAFLSRRGWLAPLLVSVQHIFHFLFKRFKP
jgi:signal peptidase I